MGGKRTLTKIDVYRHLGRVLVVRTAPQIEPEKTQGWEFVLWLDESLDIGCTVNFRRHLEELVATLSRQRPTVMHLPPYEKDENFVFGQLQRGDDCLGIYFEDDFAPYISVFAVERDLVANVLAVLLPDIVVRQGL